MPYYSRLCRRAKDLEVDYILKHHKSGIDLVIDSTGLKVSGEGAWKTKIHGKDKRRDWKKVHLAINPEDMQITSVVVTESSVADGSVLPALIEQEEKLGGVYAVAAYMWKSCFDTIADKGGKAFIDLRAGTALAKGFSKGIKRRNEIIREIWDCGSGGKTGEMAELAAIKQTVKKVKAKSVLIYTLHGDTEESWLGVDKSVLSGTQCKDLAIIGAPDELIKEWNEVLKAMAA